MKRIAVVLALVFAVVLGFKAGPVVAESMLMASEKVSSVAKDQIVDGSAYLAGESVDVEGTVKGDVYCAGQTVTISGTVEGDVLCAGQTVTINGTVHGDVRAAGMTVTVKAVVDGSVTLAGMSVSTDSASTIGRDATITAGTIDLSGSIGRDAVLAGQTVAFSGAIGRDVRASAETIKAASTAKIGGNFAYESRNEATLPSGVVAGEVQHTTPSRQQNAVAFTTADVLMGLLVAVVMFAVLTVVLTLVAPRYVHAVSDISGLKQYLFYFLVGLVAFVATPVLLLVLMVSIVGIYAAIVLAVAMTLAVLIGGSLVAYRLGRFMLDNKAQPFMSALAGSLALGVLGIIPFLGWLVLFVSTMIGLGMVVMGMRPQYAEPSPQVVPAAAQAPKTPAKRTTRSK